jgi:hypothetical protein
MDEEYAKSHPWHLMRRDHKWSIICHYQEGHIVVFRDVDEEFAAWAVEFHNRCACGHTD